MLENLGCGCIMLKAFLNGYCCGTDLLPPPAVRSWLFLCGSCSPEPSLMWIRVVLQSGRELVHPAEHEECVFMLFHQQGEKDFLPKHLFWSHRGPCWLCGQLLNGTWLHPLDLGQFIWSLLWFPPQSSALSTAEGVANSNSWIGLRNWPGTS